MAIAQVDNVRVLDRNAPRHPLARDLSVARRFETILDDGYDPAKVAASPSKSLLDHVASKPAYKTTRSTYAHPLWRHLAERTYRWAGREAWLTVQLAHHGILRVEPVDEWHAIELGLLPDTDPPSGQLDPAPLDLHVDRFATLDGLLLLLLLYREAQDAAHTERASLLKEALHSTALEFCCIYRYQGEVLDTWRLLIESRMVAWDPHVEPSAKMLHQTQAKLRAELDAGKPRGARGPAAPETLTPGTRSERRWRRRVWVRACCLHFDRVWQQPNFDYRDASPIFEWLIANRALIDAHRARAIDVLLERDDLPYPTLAPLVMPNELYRQRQHAGMSDAEWTAFGTTSIYDVIPVVSEPGPSE